MPKNFTLVVRSNKNEAQVVDAGTRRAMIAAADTLAAKEGNGFVFIGVTRAADDGIGELVHTAYFADGDDDAERIERAESTPDEVLDTPQVEVKEDAAPVIAPVVIDTLDDDSKLRLSIKGGKFAPVVLYRGIADVDGVACLVGHDVEYGKERVTPVDTLAKVEVKAKRYVEVSVDLVRTVTLPARVSEEKFADKVDAVPQSEIDAIRADQGGLDGVNDDEIAADLARLDA